MIGSGKFFIIKPIAEQLLATSCCSSLLLMYSTLVYICSHSILFPPSFPSFFHWRAAQTRYTLDDDGLILGVSPHFTDDLNTCCSKAKNDPDPGYEYVASGVCQFWSSGDRRHLTTEVGNGKFPDDGGMFDAFLSAPEIPSVLVASVIFISVVWIVLLKLFATPIVFVTECLKVLVFFYIGFKVRRP
jgi:hypothetical protein